MAIIFLSARVAQSIVHVSVRQTNAVTSVRFTAFLVQFICMGWRGVYVANHAP